MSTSATPRRRLAAAAGAILLASGLLLVACSSSMPPITAPTTTAPTTAAPGPTAAPLPGCDDDVTTGPSSRVASFAPEGPLPTPGNMPAGTYMREIQDRGRLIVGASADTYGMGFNDPINDEIVGFDIDQLHRVSQAIFGDPNRIEFKIVTYAERIPALESGEVDIVAHSMTINCARWARIDFTREYYTAGQKVLVPKESKATGIADLGGQRVCTQNGTTSIDRLKQYPDIKVVAVDDVSECVVKFQLGEADAISGDDTVLAGFVAQDPYAKVLDESLSSEPYGMGIAKGHPEFVRFVNAVLDRSIADGSWKASYDKWLSTGSADPTSPPQAVYGREP